MTPGRLCSMTAAHAARVAWVAASVAIALLVGGCSRERLAPELSIPHPVLTEMDPGVADVLRSERYALDTLLGRGRVSKAERAAALGEMGRLYQAHRLVDAAEACYREAHGLDPEHFDWAYLYGVLAARQGNLDAAVAAFERAIEIRPTDLPALVRLADQELDRGEFARARPLYQKAREIDPALAAAEYGLGRVAMEERDHESAIEHFGRAVSLQPRASVIRYHLGQAYRRLGRIEDAERELALSGPVKVAIPDPLMSAVNALVASSSPYLVQGNTALRDGRLTVAANAFRRAVEADPENLMARQGLATVLAMLRDSEGALEQLEVAAGLAPENAQAHADLGSALAEHGRDEEALEHLRRAVELEPELQPARFNLANTLARVGRLEPAEGQYRTLLEIDPGHLAARARLGTVLAQAGRLEQAIDELRQVVAQDPENEDARFNLARVHFNLGTSDLRRENHSAALEHFRSALDYDDRLAPAHYNVANLLAGSGRLTESVRHFARATELEPDHPTAGIGHATALIYLGRFSEARSVLEAVQARRSEDRPATHALARLLAGAPDTSLRDGRRSLALIAKVVEVAPSAAHRETHAMALAEVGRFREAADAQRSVLAQAREQGRAADAERLVGNLSRYESGLSCCADPKDVIPSP